MRISLGYIYGNLNIGISSNTDAYLSSNLWNILYAAENSDGKLVLKNMFSIMGNRDYLTPSGVVKDIWETLVVVRLQR